MKGTIVITDCDHTSVDIEREILAAAGWSVRLERCQTEDDVIRAGTDAVALIVQYAPIGAAVLRALHAVRVVGRYGVGLDTIDTTTAAELGIRVVNVPDYCTDEVADHALALILSLTRGIVPLDRGVQRGTWDFRLAGRVRRASSQRLGIIGLGRIGAAVARRAIAFGFDVVGVDPRGAGDTNATLVDLDTLLGTSDVVTIHAPLDAGTRHMVDSTALGRMRRTAVLVNTSRGGLVDQVALVAALQAGRIAGAALDVLEREPIAHDDPLLEMANVILTPHAAFYSEESLAEMKRKVSERVLDALAST